LAWRRAVQVRKVRHAPPSHVHRCSIHVLPVYSYNALRQCHRPLPTELYLSLGTFIIYIYSLGTFIILYTRGTFYYSL